MPKTYLTARKKKTERLIPGIREGGPTVSTHFGKPENSLAKQERKDFGMFHMKRNKQPSLPSLSTLLSSDIKLPPIDDPQPQPKAKKCAKKDIFVGKNLEDCDDETATKERNEFDISDMFTDGLSDEENIGEEFKYVVDSQDSDTESRGRPEKEARPGNRRTLGEIETANFFPRSNPSKNSSIPEAKKMKKSSTKGTEISSSGLGAKKKDFGAAAPLQRLIDPSLKPRIIQNVKIVEPFTVRVEKRASNRILETSKRENSDGEIVGDFEFDTDSLRSSMKSIFSECNIVDSQDFSNLPAESLISTPALDSEINLSQSSSLRQLSVIESQLSSPAKISLPCTKGFKLSPRYAMLPECKSPIIRGRNTCFAQKDPEENFVPVRSPGIDRNLEDTDLFSDSGVSNYSEIFSQPSYSYNPLLRVGSQLSALSKTSLPLFEEFELSPRYSKPCGGINTAFDLSQSQYSQRQRSFRRSSRTNDSTTFKFNLSNSAAREMEEISPKDKAQSNSNDSLKRRGPLGTKVNIFNVEVNNTYNGCDRVNELSGTCLNFTNSSMASKKKRCSRSGFRATVHEVQSFVSEWLNKQDESYKNRDSETMTMEENICTDPESLFSNYSCEYTEASLLKRFRPQRY